MPRYMAGYRPDPLVMGQWAYWDTWDNDRILCRGQEHIVLRAAENRNREWEAKSALLDRDRPSCFAAYRSARTSDPALDEDQHFGGAAA